MSKAAELANLIGNINAGGGGVGRNLFINGAMQVAQRSTSADNGGGGYQTVDRLRHSQNSSGLGNYNSAQVADAPTGFNKSFKFTKDGATSMGSGNSAYFQQNIEGQNLQHLKYGTSDAVPLTASFYVKSSLTGTFGLSLEENGNSRSNVQTYTISSANTWELKSVTFVGDTASALANDNTNELSLRFAIGVGSNYQTSSTNTWASGDKLGTSSQTQLTETDNATFFLTGVQLEVGQNPTSFEHEPFERTLEKCQRYFFRWDVDATSLGAGIFYSASQVLAYHKYPRTMRASPTMSNSGSGCVYAYSRGTNLTQGGGVVHDNIGKDTMRWNFTVTSNGTVGDGTYIQLPGGEFVQGDAEL